MYWKQKISQKDIAKKFNINTVQVHRILNDAERRGSVKVFVTGLYPEPPLVYFSKAMKRSTWCTNTVGAFDRAELCANSTRIVFIPAFDPKAMFLHFVDWLTVYHYEGSLFKAQSTKVLEDPLRNFVENGECLTYSHTYKEPGDYSVSVQKYKKKKGKLSTSI